MDKLKDLLPKFEEANDAYEAAKAQFEKAGEKVEQDWDKIEEASKAFLERVKNERSDFADETQTTLEGIAALKTKVEEITDSAKEAANDAREELNNFAEEIQKLEPEIEKVMKMVDDAASALKQRGDAIKEKVNEVASDMSSFLEGEISSAFTDIQDAVETRAGELMTHIADTIVPKMEEKAADLAQNLSDFASDMGQKMTDKGAEAMQNATDVLESCFGTFKDTIDQIMSLGDTMQNVLDKVCGFVNDVGDVVGQTQQAVSTGVDTTSVGLNAVVGTIQEILDFFSSFSF
jgi:chromosome segregation ATPase